MQEQKLHQLIKETRPVPGFSVLEKQKPPFTMVEPAWLPETRLPILPPAPRPAISAAERHRLVEAPKCPTPPELDPKGTYARHIEAKNWFEAMGGDWPTFWRQGVRKVDVPSPHGYDVDEFFESGSLVKAPRTPEAISTHEVDGVDSAKTCAWAVISHRKWSGEYRVRTQVDQPHALPPEQGGARITHTLTENGARKIADSCAFTHLKHGGFRTFVTLTLDTAGRSRVESRQAEGPCTEVTQTRAGFTTVYRRHQKLKNHIDTNGEKLPEHDGPATVIVWEQGKPYADADRGGKWFAPGEAVDPDEGDDMTFGTVQKEVSRFFDAAHKMRQRGWKAEKTYPWGKVKCWEREGVQVGEEPSPIVGIKGYLADPKITLKRQGVRYCWVVENPLNERGQRNPHIHILMDWRVKFSAFASWADRLENLWGQGFAHIEKIKDSSLAGAYMAKAAGYMSKGSEGEDQGPVRGNRYGISADARAPEWCQIGKFSMHIMGHLIKDVHDYFTHSFSAHFKARRELKQKLDATPKQDKRTRTRIGRALAKCRNYLNNLPAIASKHQIILRNRDHFDEFWQWATLPRPQGDGEWLPGKSESDHYQPETKPEGGWLQEFQFRLHARKAARKFKGLGIEHYTRWIKQEPHADNDPEAPPPWWSAWREWESIAA
ncbi:rolling circle replication-associated protein [Halobacteriovorax sp. RT-1-3]|uniref:rolling circle replication-associated protein n=2 Tax=unclassified Halobacteriovorax TaxID=2639665 RepID=UPI0039995686